MEIWLLRSDLAVVRISDIAYRLTLHPDALDVVLMHGAMQIDAFTTLYRWEDERCVSTTATRACATRSTLRR